MYLNWIHNNYLHQGRYTLNYLNPKSYGVRQFIQAGIAKIMPLFRKPPTFHDRRPWWHNGSVADEGRFQNGAIWAGIPEEEVCISLIKRNIDGSYRPSRILIEENIYNTQGKNLVDDGLTDSRTIEKAKKYEYVRDRDFFSTLGGEHSNYSIMEEHPYFILWKQSDRQQLNPQWMLSDVVKRFISVTSEWYQRIHEWGRKDWGERILGYKPFEYKLGIGIDKSTGRTFYFDPEAYKLGIAVPE